MQHNTNCNLVSRNGCIIASVQYKILGRVSGTVWLHLNENYIVAYCKCLLL